MLNALDLTPRQATRLLEQAIRVRARLEIEPQSLPQGPVIRGALVARDGNILTVEVLPQADVPPAIALIGAFCEIRSPLAGETFFFTTYVLDVVEGSGPARLLFSAPDLIQVVNRRRFERTNTTVASHVRLYPRGQSLAVVGLMANISPVGLGFTLSTCDCDDPVLLGDDVRVQFELAGFDETFELPAVVCNKSLSADRERLVIGLEFSVGDDNLVARHTLSRVHGMLNEMMNDTARTEGHP